MTDTNAREAAIDENIAKTHSAYFTAAMRAEEARQNVLKYEGNSSRENDFYARNAAEIKATIPALVETMRTAEAAYIEAEKQYTGWARFFLVQNTNGHIHSSMSCSSCTFTTQFGWLTDMSALTEAEAVAAHGERLCTVCFPSAPSNWTEGYYERISAERKAEKAAAKAEKAAAKAARAAKRAETVHYFERFIRADGEVIDHSDNLRSLKPLAKFVAECNEAPVEYGRHYVVDANTGEVVA